MKQFNYVQDFEEWLEPMEFDEFWSAVLPYGIMMDHKVEAEEDVAAGITDKATALVVLKMLARREMKAKYNLEWRIDVPEMLLH